MLYVNIGILAAFPKERCWTSSDLIQTETEREGGGGRESAHSQPRWPWERCLPLRSSWPGCRKNIERFVCWQAPGDLWVCAQGQAQSGRWQR